MNIYLRTILSVPALLIFIVAWFAAALIAAIGTVLARIAAAVNRQTENLLDWINPRRREYRHIPIEDLLGSRCCWGARLRQRCTCAYDAATNVPPQHPNCRCGPLDRSCPYVGGDPATSVSFGWAHRPATGAIIGIDDLPSADRREIEEAARALDDEDSQWPGGWL